ncbi:cell surface spherulin 4 family protein [Glarea lozoyensis ATCC 20868]|uniref:Cell surface spherulin 4 family protein n=1 Tax=Glarea lozoyensis (strain ATCC 20868 / MF5171) TaxID=1116229 RepID=S3CQC3_GLAL2|nr:cell surface spherulin 4 family protein [Glarea lozoyensis ATCC 20868]EPE27895.1 cell surface spherulin 4 family protein [Glarea lozoyensis ATCC 20868]
MFWRKKNPEKPTVLVPLYVYPEHGSWNLLYAIIKGNPQIEFLIIINPNSGPGSEDLPDENYTEGITLLNGYANVTLVGYISTDYFKRDINHVLKDVRTYAGWSKGKGFGDPNSKQKDLGLRGVFLDETPNEWSVDAGRYLERLTGVIKSHGDEPIIIHNPGTIPSPLFTPYATLTVMFEGSYDIYKSANMTTKTSVFAKMSKASREKLAVILHSLPKTMGDKEETQMMKGLNKHFGAVFVTALNVNYYESFGEEFQSWVGGLSSK